MKNIYLNKQKYTFKSQIMSLKIDWNCRFWFFSISTNQNGDKNENFWKNLIFVISAKFQVKFNIGTFWSVKICVTPDYFCIFFRMHKFDSIQNPGLNLFTFKKRITNRCKKASISWDFHKWDLIDYR